MSSGVTDGGEASRTFCAGFLRGLAFCGDYAVVGLSQPRQDKETINYTHLVMHQEFRTQMVMIL
jgi:hypothetical protein